MPYKPMSIKQFEKYIKVVGWKFIKGSIDWNLYDEKDYLICSFIISHGKNTKSEVTAFSIHKIKKAFNERGLKWPPNLK